MDTTKTLRVVLSYYIQLRLLQITMYVVLVGAPLGTMCVNFSVCVPASTCFLMAELSPPHACVHGLAPSWNIETISRACVVVKVSSISWIPVV